jgi:uncharacterized protein
MNDEGRLSARLINWLIAAVLAYAMTIGALMLFQRNLLYLTDPTAVAPMQWGVPDMQVIGTRTEDGLNILSWYKPPSDPTKPLVIFCQGNAGHFGYRGFKSRILLDAGYGVLQVGYRGYSGNGGNPTEQGLYRDARAAVEYAKAQGYSGDRIVIYGESLGSGVAVQMASEYKSAALVLEAPYTSIPDVASNFYPFVPVHLIMMDRFDSLAKIPFIARPLLIIHGEEDKTVPFVLGKKLFDTAKEPKSFVAIPRAGHSDLFDRGAAEAVLKFLATLPPLPTAP